MDWHCGEVDPTIRIRNQFRPSVQPDSRTVEGICLSLRRGLSWLVQGLLLLLTCWAAAAIWFDFPLHRLHAPLAIAYFLLILALLRSVRRLDRRLPIWALSVGVVIVWWFSLQPSNSRHWQADVAQMPWSEVYGDRVILHNVRDFEYVTETDYKPRWKVKEVSLSQISGVDLFVTYWGSPWIAHAIVSFSIGAGDHLAMSIEARKEVGESYSAVRGFFRQYELIYLAAEERDVVRLRTNYRRGESVYLYRTRTTPADARRLFLQYLRWMDQVRRKPEWYNALSSNCTSNVTGYLAASKVGGLSRWDWRNILNGRGDEMLYELGDLVADGLPFAELKIRALINPAAQHAASDATFSAIIREGRPGF